MKFCLALIALTLTCVSLGGCATNPDDKEFFYSHWVKPSEMDSERPTRIPRQQSNPGDNALPVTDPNAAPARGREWDTPEQY